MFKFLKLTFILIINILLVETGLQLTYFLLTRGSWLPNRATGQPFYMHNYELGTYGLIPNFSGVLNTNEFKSNIFINERGMRVKDFSNSFINKSDNKELSPITGLAIGPSYGFGWGVNYEDSYNYKIAEYISKKTNAQINLLNTSVPAQPIGQQMCRLIKEISKDEVTPKFVVVTVFPGLEYLQDECIESNPNEVWQSYLIGNTNTKYLKFKKVVKNSGIVYFSFLLASKIMPSPDSEKLGYMKKYIKIENLKSTEKIIKNAKKIRDNLGEIPIIYIRMPHPFQYHPTHINRWRTIKTINDLLKLSKSEEENWNYALRIKDQFKEKNIYLIDTLPLLKNGVKRGEDMAYYLDTHLTLKGNIAILNSFINQIDSSLFGIIEKDEIRN